jgi:hypothetical protein
MVEQKKTLEFLKYALSNRPPGDFKKWLPRSTQNTVAITVPSQSLSNQRTNSNGNLTLLSINTKGSQARDSSKDIVTFNPTPANFNH